MQVGKDTKFLLTHVQERYGSGKYDNINKTSELEVNPDMNEVNQNMNEVNRKMNEVNQQMNEENQNMNEMTPE